MTLQELIYANLVTSRLAKGDGLISTARHSISDAQMLTKEYEDRFINQSSNLPKLQCRSCGGYFKSDHELTKHLIDTHR